MIQVEIIDMRATVLQKCKSFLLNKYDDLRSELTEAKDNGFLFLNGRRLI